MSRLLDLSRAGIKKFKEEAEVTELQVEGPTVIWAKKDTPKELERETERFKKNGYEGYIYSSHMMKWTKGQFNRVNTIE